MNLHLNSVYMQFILYATAIQEKPVRFQGLIVYQFTRQFSDSV